MRYLAETSDYTYFTSIAKFAETSDYIS